MDAHASKGYCGMCEAELRALVDDQMREELSNLKILFDEAHFKRILVTFLGRRRRKRSRRS